MATSTLLLDAHLKALRLPTFLREYDKVARQCAHEGLDCPRYLFRLCELELLDREQRATERRIKAATCPVVKSLETFEFRAIPSLNKSLVLELARSAYLDRRENVLALGNSGTGKTHLALALGLAACQKGYRVRFTTAAALVNDLLEDGAVGQPPPRAAPGYRQQPFRLNRVDHVADVRARLLSLIVPPRQRFTWRCTWRVRLRRLSMAFVVASDRWRRSDRPKPSTVSVWDISLEYKFTVTTVDGEVAYGDSRSRLRTHHLALGLGYHM